MTRVLQFLNLAILASVCSLQFAWASLPNQTAAVPDQDKIKILVTELNQKYPDLDLSASLQNSTQTLEELEHLQKILTMESVFGTKLNSGNVGFEQISCSRCECGGSCNCGPPRCYEQDPPENPY